MIAAASAAVKLGSAVMAAVAAVTVSARLCGGFTTSADDNCKPENFDWLCIAWPKICGRDVGCGSDGDGKWN